jgi:hypothetical protein
MEAPAGYKYQVGFGNGIFALFHEKSNKWHLFRNNVRLLGKFNTLKEAERSINEREQNEDLL